MRERPVARSGDLERDESRPGSRSMERLVAILLLAFAVGVRVVSGFRYAPNSDESQHLHVVWGWTRGLVQYRDLTDNHAPLFHLLHAPLLGSIGERPEALALMRLALLPLFGLSLWAVYWIGRALFSRRTGLWAAVLTSLLPPFALCSLEFRADGLWATLWLLALACFLGTRASTATALTTGLLLGAALAASIKTVFLLVGMIGALFLTRARGLAGADPSGSIGHRVKLAAAFLTGFAALPVAVGLYLGHLGAWSSFVEAVLIHNSGAVGYRTPGAWVRALLLPPILWLTYVSVRPESRHGDGIADEPRRRILWATSLLALASILVISPALHRQDMLPLLPIAAIALAAMLVPSTTRCSWAVALIAGEALWLISAALPWRDGMESHRRLVNEVLHLTSPDEPVMDSKGEAVFRRRSSRLVLEGMTVERLRRGLLADSIPEDLIRTRTHVVVLDGVRFPDRAKEFVTANYLWAGDLWVAGKMLTEGASDSPCTISFRVEIPGRYVILAGDGEAARGGMTLDGEEYTGARDLPRGAHELLLATCPTPLALVWARGAERGFSPFRAIEDRPA